MARKAPARAKPRRKTLKAKNPHSPKLQHHVPTNDRDKAFCAAWLTHYDHNRAYEEAGFSAKSKKRYTMAREKLDRFMPYLRPIQAAKAEQAGKQLAIKEGDVLETMRAIAYANIQDYYVKTDRPVIRQVRKGDQVIDVPVLSNGQPVYHMDPKPLYELTREQAMAIEPVYNIAGQLMGYKPVTQKVRHQYLESLGKNLGLWLEDLVKRREVERHKHIHLHLDAVPTEKVIEAERMLLGIAGPEFARSLGYTAEEIAAAIEGQFEEVKPALDPATAPLVGT